MRLPRRPEPTYANVMSTIAVFLALGGTSYAVARNSVGTPQLKNNAVTSAKVRDGALQAQDFAAGALLRGPRGATGPQGQSGPAGPAGTPPAAEGWKALPMENLFGALGDVWGVPQYRKDGAGMVHLRGIATRRDALPTVNIVMATLPPGYRPPASRIFVVQIGEPRGAGRLDIHPNGQILWGGGPSIGETDYTSLDGIFFATD